MNLKEALFLAVFLIILTLFSELIEFLFFFFALENLLATRAAQILPLAK